LKSDLYKILGVRSSASEEELRAAYRDLSQRFRPDANKPDIRQGSRFKNIAAAYQLLSDPVARREYDEANAADVEFVKAELHVAPNVPPTDSTRLSRPHPIRHEAELAVSAHDRVSSFMVAMLYLVGFIVFLLFLVWLTTRATTVTAPIAVEYLDELIGGEQSFGDGRDFIEPGVEDIQDLANPDVQDLLAAVTAVASTSRASSNRNVSQGKGSGDRRRVESGGNVSVPRWQRWEVRFTATSLEAYAQQLQSFNIELAAAGGGRKQIDYATGFGNPKPTTRSGSGTDEKRLYMSYRRGQLKEFDRQLLRKAGIPTEGRTLLQFYPPNLENVLATLEQRAARGRLLKDIRKTVFVVKKSGGSYKFAVIDQQYY